MKIITVLHIITLMFFGCKNLESPKPFIKTIKETTYGESDNGKMENFLMSRLDLFGQEHLIDEQEYYFESGTIKSKWKYFYDGDQPLKFIEYDNKGNILSEYICDIEPDIKVEIKKITNGLLENSTISNYNNKQVTKETKYDEVGKVVREKTFEYNDKGQNIKTTEYSKEAHMTWIYWYEYNENGNLTEQNWSDEVGFILSTTTYIYGLDENQNWIKKETYEDDKLKYISIRELDYFD